MSETVTQAERRLEMRRAFMGGGTDTLLSRPEVEAILGMSRTTIYRKMRGGWRPDPDGVNQFTPPDPAFPQPVRIGRRAIRWHSDDVLAYRDQLIAG